MSIQEVSAEQFARLFHPANEVLELSLRPRDPDVNGYLMNRLCRVKGEEHLIGVDGESD